MHKLTTAVFALMFASTLLAEGHTCAPGKARVFADDHVIFANGLSGERLDALKAKYGKVFLYVERGDKTYVVTDGDTLDRVRHILLPQTQLGYKQATLGSQQAALGTKQAALGLEQARVAMQQASAAQSKREALEKKQAALSRQQEALSKQQEALGAKQDALEKDSDAQIDTVLDQAIREGLAKQVN